MSFAHAYGAFLGVLCADAAGATLEFSRVAMTPALVADAMRMPGGGIRSIGRGQTTDDSELALSLAHALVDHSPRDGLPLDAVASKYHEWWSSKPLDIGNTCHTAFGISDAESTDAGLGRKMVERSAEKNVTSEANGSLMRILPLAIWGSKLPDEQLIQAARQEATLSHPHQICQDCNAVYCLLVAHLIDHPGDRDGALHKAEAFVQRADVHPTVREWFQSESLDASAMNTLKAKGHVRWAFALAIYHLRQGSSYEQAIQETLLKGGDTDTNAAIVGGLIGALHSVDAIPDYMRKPVLEFDCSSPWVQGKRRPALYRSSLVEELTCRLLVQANSVGQDAVSSAEEIEYLRLLFPTIVHTHGARPVSSETTPESLAYGAFLGVLCGDAAGATLEFSRVPITRKLAAGAMRMPGGGIWRVGEGQITDDSELALSLARALVDHAPRDGLPLDAVASKYHEWWSSNPYDIGNTCRTAFGVDDAETAGPLGACMVARSSEWNTQSQANGSLMRILPLAIWASRLPDEQLVRAARLEATLSHPHQICQDCNAVYTLLVAHLIHHPGDREGALQKAAAFVDRGDVHATVRQWFHRESLDASALDCSQAIGHVRWAFALAIYHLRQGSSYEQAIEETLLKGGDTDTNAAIVGGLMGALHGVEAIPEFMREPVLAFDCSAPGRGQKRPAVYRSAQAQELTRALLKRADEASS